MKYRASFAYSYGNKIRIDKAIIDVDEKEEKIDSEEKIEMTEEFLKNHIYEEYAIITKDITLLGLIELKR